MEDFSGLEDAVEIAELGLKAFAGGASPEMTERRAAAIIEGELIQLGVLTSLVFVSSGPFFGQRPSSRLLSNGELITVLVEIASLSGYWVEIGAIYSSDKTTSMAQELAECCIASLAETAEGISNEVECSVVADYMVERLKRCGGIPMGG